MESRVRPCKSEVVILFDALGAYINSRKGIGNHVSLLKTISHHTAYFSPMDAKASSQRLLAVPVPLDWVDERFALPA